MSATAQAFVYITLYSLLMSAAEIVAKILAADLPITQVVWSRYIVLLPVLLVVFRRRLGAMLVHPQRGKLAFRGLTPVIASFFIIGSYRFMPVADAVSVMFSSQLMVTLLAIPLLGERVGPVRGAAVAAGFAGVLLVVQPSVDMQAAALLPLVAAVLFAIYQIMSRTLFRDSVDAVAMVFYLALVGAVFTAAVVPWVWQTPKGIQWLWVAAEGVCYGLGHFCMTMAFVRAEASALSPFIYLQVPGTMLLGLLAFGHFPGAITLAGMALIVGSGLLVWLRERRQAAQKRAKRTRATP